jgi:hypothetical protein
VEAVQIDWGLPQSQYKKIAEKLLSISAENKIFYRSIICVFNIYPAGDAERIRDKKAVAFVIAPVIKQ